jgi:hypothetical protein
LGAVGTVLRAVPGLNRKQDALLSFLTLLAVFAMNRMGLVKEFKEWEMIQSQCAGNAAIDHKGNL